MIQDDNSQSVAEIKLAWAYTLLASGFSEMTKALATIDENAAWGLLADINNRIARTLRDEDARLTGRGYPSGHLKEVFARLSETIMAAGQAISVELPTSGSLGPVIDAFGDSLAFAALVREAQRSNSKVA